MTSATTRSSTSASRTAAATTENRSARVGGPRLERANRERVSLLERAHGNLHEIDGREARNPRNQRGASKIRTLRGAARRNRSKDLAAGGCGRRIAHAMRNTRTLEEARHV